ncbi:hypothetical protein JHK82_016240 [Glycine max]|nr:hypothetical protein JHK85_016648 [Glycine max]KAG5046872.1 hypothetical protein JHK86_016278 [Glycine max]KAG5149359.1 hypothetical protein JHK82_016240 [Glycine max]
MAKAKASTGIVGLEVVQNEGGADWAVQQDAEGDLEGGGLIQDQNTWNKARTRLGENNFFFFLSLGGNKFE